MSTNPCRRCGTDAGAGVPQPRSCGDCPPVPCSDCGGADDRYCACWTSLEGLALADIKGLLAAADMGLTVTQTDDEADQ